MGEVRFKVTQTAEGRKIEKALKEIEKLSVFIGYQAGEATSEEGVDVAEYAAYNELGTSRGIPSRPFIRNSVDANAGKIEQFQNAMCKQLLNGASAESVLKQIGVFQRDLIRVEITDGSFAPNSPATIKRKGSAKPLIDTGLMRASVNYQVGKKGEFG